jgi:cyclin-dependent kinase 7
MVDIWSAGCILGELLIRVPMFPGTTDIDQLGKIFTVRGTPTLEDWPGVDELPNYLEFTIKESTPLSKIFP